jgi:integrase
MAFAVFAKDFFVWNGEYISRLKLRGKQIGQRHADNQQAYLDNYLIPAFGSDKLKIIDSDRIQDFAFDLVDKGLSASTINHVLLTLKIVLQVAHRKKYIQVVPEIDMVFGVKAERGILMPEEVTAFFAQPWKDPRYFTINLLAATTGMRLGEILGLQRQAVHHGYIAVKTSWERGKGLKGTKTGRPRIAPMPPKVEEVLRTAMERSPFTDPSDFVFPGRKRTAPLDHKMPQRSYNEALESIGIDEVNRTSRGLTFHSWRHFFNSLLINARIPLIKVQKLTGHSTDQMSETYFHPDEYCDVIKITEKIF